MLETLAVFVFLPAMWYGVVSMALAYLADDMRSLSAPAFLAGAILLPGAAALVVPFAAATAGRGPAFLFFILAAPLGLALLWLRVRSTEGAGGEYLRRYWAGQHAEADAVLAENPDDPFALLQKARTHEEQEQYEEALKAYERVHALSQKMISVYKMEDHRRRLGMLLEKQREDAARKARLFRLENAHVEFGFLALGLLLLTVVWPLGLQLICYMSFVRWFNSGTRWSQT